MTTKRIDRIALTSRNLILGFLLVALCPTGVLAGDGVVALQTAEASCRDGSTAIYVNCGNGTVTDNRTGLVWLKNADCLGPGGVDWYTAMEFVAGLADLDDSFCANKGLTAAECDCGLSDGSSPGEWRLPSAAEWQAMVADADGGLGELDCDPTITRDQGNGCWSQLCSIFTFCSFSLVQSDFYWSASSFVQVPGFAWLVNLSNGNVNMGVGKSASGSHVWPVRGGQ